MAGAVTSVVVGFSVVGIVAIVVFLGVVVAVVVGSSVIGFTLSVVTVVVCTWAVVLIDFGVESAASPSSLPPLPSPLSSSSLPTR